MLDGSIKFKIKCWCNAELGQGMFHGRLHESINNLFVIKLDFLLGRMYVDIEVLRVKIDEQCIHGETVFGDQFLKCIHDGMIEVSAFYETVVHKKILVSPCFFSSFRLAYKTINIQVICLLFYTHQLSIVTVTQYLYNALFECALIKMKYFLSV